MPTPAVLVKPQVTVLLALLVMVTLPVTASQAPVARPVRRWCGPPGTGA